MADSGFYLVAVHGGAGYHASTKSAEAELKKALRSACTHSLKLLRAGKSSLSVVEEAISILEDDECLNAGHGSNLTLSGSVECDASIMDGRTCDFGSVGAVSGVRNPIKLAHAVLEHARKPDPLGRIPPLTLVSDGALNFAASHEVAVVPSESLVSPRARQEWIRWKTALQSSAAVRPLEEGYPEIQGLASATGHSGLHAKQDTVGAVAWASDGGLAAGVSSGGLLLKHSGRVGEAAVYGAGCWAQQPLSDRTRGVACSVSGAGEAIIRASLARAVGDAFEVFTDDDDPHAVLEGVLIQKLYANGRAEACRNSGLIVLLRDTDSSSRTVARLWCAFTTESMAVAYASSLDPKPKAVILRRTQPASGHSAPIFITALPLTRA